MRLRTSRAAAAVLPQRSPLLAMPARSRSSRDLRVAPRAASISSSSSSHHRPSSAAAAAMITVDEEEMMMEQKQQQKQTTPKMSPEERAASLRALERAATPPPHEQSPSYPPEFVARRWWAFAGIVVGYTAFYVTRSSLTYAAPLMVADPSSGVTLSTVGALTSVFPVAYGASKFASGVLGSKVSARLMLSCGLALTAAVNLAFGFGGPAAWLCALWAANGVLQGCGAPTCASILTRWYAAKERGTYWGAWSMSHNLGGFLAPVVVGSAATALGWRWGMWAPAVIGACVAGFIALAVRDSPGQCGFNGLPEGKAGGSSTQQQQEAKEKTVSQPRLAADVAADKSALSSAIARAANDKSASPIARLVASLARSTSSLTQGPVGAVLRNPLVWALAFTYFFVYVVRQGVTSWLMFYLMAEKGVADATTAALTVSGLELGGLCGGAAAGLISDQAIKRAGPGAGHVGRRVRVCMAYTAGMAVALLALKAVPAGQPVLLAASVAALGFCIYGPQMLVGLAGAELVSPAGVGASQGLLGWIAYLGAANAGVPIAAIVQRSGWAGFFTAMLSATALVMLLLSSASNARSYAQKEAKTA